MALGHGTCQDTRDWPVPGLRPLSPFLPPPLPDKLPCSRRGRGGGPQSCEIFDFVHEPMLLGHLHSSFSSPTPPGLLHFSQLKVPSSSSYRFALLLPTLPFLLPFQNHRVQLALPVRMRVMGQLLKHGQPTGSHTTSSSRSQLQVGPPEPLPNPCPSADWLDLVWIMCRSSQLL